MYSICYVLIYEMEKEMATHSSILAWGIPGTENPGGLPSMGSHRVGHNWSNLAAAAAYMKSLKIYLILLRMKIVTMCQLLFMKCHLSVLKVLNIVFENF